MTTRTQTITCTVDRKLYSEAKIEFALRGIKFSPFINAQLRAFLKSVKEEVQNAN